MLTCKLLSNLFLHIYVEVAWVCQKRSMSCADTYVFRSDYVIENECIFWVYCWLINKSTACFTNVICTYMLILLEFVSKYMYVYVFRSDVIEYSKEINSLLGNQNVLPDPAIEDPRTVVQVQ